MKVTLIVPPVLVGKHPAERSSGCTRVVYPTPNIYELTVAALVEKEGHSVAYEDFVYDGRTKEDLAQFLKHDDSDVYCLWTVNLSLENDGQAAEMIHEARPDVLLVWMGPAPTYFTETCLKTKQDVVVRGEPEQTLAELLRKVRVGEDWHEIDGISFRDEEGRCRGNKMRPLMRDLDSLPFPARHLLKGRVYRNPKLKVTPYTTAVTSRNCPFHCIYCVPSSLTFAREIENRRTHGRKPVIGFRSVKSVDAELAEISRLGYKAVGFMDDNFIWNEERTLAICDSLRRHGLKWGCQARVDAITEPIAKALGESDCMYVDLGVESFNDEILQFVKKGITAAQIDVAVDLLKRYKVPVKLNILIGTSPLETKETLKETLRRAKALNVSQVMFNIVAPFPGTEFYDIAKENGWIENGEYVPTDVQRDSILNYPHLSSREMEKILFRSNLSYFLSPRFVLHQMSKFRSFGDFTHALRTLANKLFG